jgi:hypothetical protein
MSSPYYFIFLRVGGRPPLRYSIKRRSVFLHRPRNPEHLPPPLYTGATQPKWELGRGSTRLDCNHNLGWVLACASRNDERWGDLSGSQTRTWEVPAKTLCHYTRSPLALFAWAHQCFRLVIPNKIAWYECFSRPKRKTKTFNLYDPAILTKTWTPLMIL